MDRGQRQSGSSRKGIEACREPKMSPNGHLKLCKWPEMARNDGNALTLRANGEQPEKEPQSTRYVVVVAVDETARRLQALNLYVMIVCAEEGESKTESSHVGNKRDVPSPRRDDTTVPYEPPGQPFTSMLSKKSPSLSHHTQNGFIAIQILSHHSFEPIGIFGIHL